MAKAQGIEPQLAVLETAVLPLDHALKFDNKKAPTVSDQGCKILSCVRHALKPQLILYTIILLASCQYFFNYFFSRTFLTSGSVMNLLYPDKIISLAAFA